MQDRGRGINRPACWAEGNDNELHAQVSRQALYCISSLANNYTHAGASAKTHNAQQRKRTGR